MRDENLIDEYVKKSLASIERCLDCTDQLILVAKLLENTLNSGKKILFCGNGGSAAQSQHLAAEFSGRFLLERPALSSISLTTDTSAITAIANDYGYNMIFKRQLAAIGASGDVLIGISTSGKSPNVIEAFKEASKKGIKTVALMGPEETEMSKISDHSIHCTGESTNFVQEQQFVVGHILCCLVEKNADYKKLMS